MKDTKVTIASVRSVLNDVNQNLALVENVCAQASDAGSRLVLFPELMLTGHGGHPKVAENAEAVPSGPLSSEVVKLSAKYDLCICAGIAELSHGVVYNSQMVADNGVYLGLQRKVNMSGDEYLYFGVGETVEVFDIGDLRLGITICYDNQFPEFNLIHSLNHCDVVLAPHAWRTGEWPAEITPEFCAEKIKRQQDNWAKVQIARAFDHNVFVLISNAVGSAFEGLDDAVGSANHAGTIMAFSPDGEAIARTRKTDFADEVVTIELDASKRKVNHGPTRNRRKQTVIEMLKRAGS